MYYLLLTVVIFGLYWLYAYLHKRLTFWREHGIPYIPPMFVMGNMGGPIFRRKHFDTVIREIYACSPEAKYVGAYDFIRPTVMLRDPDLIKAVTIKSFDDFPDHYGAFDETLDPLVGGNLFNMKGDLWREARNLLTPAFTASKMKGMFVLMAECAQNFQNYMVEVAKDPKNVIDTKNVFTKYTNDAIASCAFGISVDSLKDPKNDFYVLGTEGTSFNGLNGVKFLFIRAFPRLARLLKLKFVSDRVSKFFMDVVQTTVQVRDEKGIQRPDMIQLMMDARGKTSENLKLDITAMTSQAFTFFFGGFDTTSTQMCIIAHELAINPDIQEKLQAEIDEVLENSKDGQPTYEAVNAMPYLDAVFNESMRRHTQAAMLDRVCMSPFELPPALPGGKPFVIQPGMSVWIPVSGINKDEKYYENPFKFDPERYLHQKVTLNQTMNMSFGIGPRACIGNRFAILETKVLFFYLLAKFTLKPNKNTSCPFEYSLKNIAVSPKGGWTLSIEPRKSVSD